MNNQDQDMPGQEQPGFVKATERQQYAEALRRLLEEAHYWLRHDPAQEDSWTPFKC
jgi:hypothetical protein